MITRDQIAKVLHRLNAAENLGRKSSAEEKSRGIDAVMSPTVHGWRNGVPVPDRQAERAAELAGFARCPDYHREFDRMIVEPPRATIGWTIRGTIDGRAIVAPGCSIFEFGEDGLVSRYWLYADLSPFGAAR
jgi:hypothetical protein